MRHSMRRNLNDVEHCRVRKGPFASEPGDKHGHFNIYFDDALLNVIVSRTQEDFEVVSVELKTRFPTWKELIYIKSCFWDDEDVVMTAIPNKSKLQTQSDNSIFLTCSILNLSMTIKE